MIVLIAIAVFWFTELSTIPTRLMMAFDFALSNWFVRNFLRLISCSKCLGFWSGLGYSLYETRHIGISFIMAAISSTVGIVLTRINDKTL